MRQAVMTQPGKIEFRDAPEPSAGPGEVLLRIQRIGVCGSDMHVYHGRHPYTTYPVVQGHEFGAVIEALGDGVTGLEVGAKATALPQLVCGQCRPCLRGDWHICEDLKVRGFQAEGAAQDLYVAAAERIVPLPDDFSFDQGALVEPTAVAVRAVSRAGDIAGRNVVVLGAGPIGNLVAQTARAAGANVLITDLSDFRLDVARRCGIEHVSNASGEGLDEAVRRAFGGQGFDVALECAGAPEAIAAAIANIGKGGTIIVVGVFADPPAVDLAGVQEWELTLRGTLMYQREDYLQAARAIAAGRIVTDPLVTKHFPFADYLAAYHYIERSGPEAMKVLIDL